MIARRFYTQERASALRRGMLALTLGVTLGAGLLGAYVSPASAHTPSHDPPTSPTSSSGTPHCDVIGPNGPVCPSLPSLPSLGTGVNCNFGGIASQSADPCAGQGTSIIPAPQTGSAPVLTGFELQPAMVAPGGLVKVDGTNFGAERGNGSLCMAWSSVLVQNAYTANGRLCLDVVDWQDTRVIAEVPSDVEGVPDQNAEVTLTTNGGLISNGLVIKFVATRETVQLTNQPVKYSTVCDQQTETDSCGPASGYHFDGFLISFGNSGTDRFHIVLANGWFLQSSMTLQVTDGSVSLNPTPAVGATTLDFSVSWAVGGTVTNAIYNVNVMLTGPKGVPLE